MYAENESEIGNVRDYFTGWFFGWYISSRSDKDEFRYLCRIVQSVQYKTVSAAGNSNEGFVLEYSLNKNGTAAFFMDELFFESRNMDACMCRGLDIVFGRNAAAFVFNKERRTGSDLVFLLHDAAMAFIYDYVEKADIVLSDKTETDRTVWRKISDVFFKSDMSLYRGMLV